MIGALGIAGCANRNFQPVARFWSWNAPVRSKKRTSTPALSPDGDSRLEASSARSVFGFAGWPFLLLGLSTLASATEGRGGLWSGCILIFRRSSDALKD